MKTVPTEILLSRLGSVFCLQSCNLLFCMAVKIVRLCISLLSAFCLVSENFSFKSLARGTVALQLCWDLKFGLLHACFCKTLSVLIYCLWFAYSDYLLVILVGLNCLCCLWDSEEKGCTSLVISCLLLSHLF